MIEIVPASLTHVGPIASRIRPIDALECAVSGRTAKQSLRIGVFHSLMAWTALVNGRPEAMFGVLSTSLLEGSGCVWMLMTEDGGKQHRALMRLSRIYLRAIHNHVPLLHNMVHADNEIAIRWLARLGFVIGPVDVINGQPMRGFSLCAIQ